MEGPRRNRGEKLLSIDKLGGYKTEVKETVKGRERLALRQKAKGGTFRYYTGGERRDRNENVIARPNKLRENVVQALARKGPGLCREEERGMPVVGGWKRKRANRGALEATQTTVEPTSWNHVSCAR